MKLLTFLLGFMAIHVNAVICPAGKCIGPGGNCLSSIHYTVTSDNKCTKHAMKKPL